MIYGYHLFGSFIMGQIEAHSEEEAVERVALMWGIDKNKVEVWEVEK